MVLGMPFLFVPISVMSYVGVPQEKNNEVSGLTALARNVGGSIGVSFISTMLVRRAQVHQEFLSAHVYSGAPQLPQSATVDFAGDGGRRYFVGQCGELRRGAHL